jgi:O-antigen ligase
MGIVLVWRNLEKWPKVDLLDVGLLALTAYLLRGAKSTTSIIVFLLGTALLIAQSLMKWDFRKLNRAIIVGLCVLLVVQVLAVSFIGRSIAPGVFAAAGKDASLTGRIPLWRELIQMGSRTAVLGSGFASFWLNPARLSELWSRVNWTPTTAHNGYIEVFLDLGIIGLLILFFLLVQTFKNIIRSFDGDPEFSKLKAVLFMMIFFHNFSESSYGKPSALLWLLFLLVSIVIRAKPGEEADLAPQPWA